MNKIKNILSRINNVASKYPRYLFIVGILFGVTLTCFIGNIALKNNNIENVNKNNEKNITDKSIKKKENYDPTIYRECSSQILCRNFASFFVF